MYVLPTGYYYIINEQWGNRAALCDWDYHENYPVKAEADDTSDNAKWYVKQLQNKKYTFRNAGRILYAVVESGSHEQSPVQGKSHNHNQQWKLTEQREPGKYIIEKTDTWLVWSLPDGEIKTTVELTRNTHDRRAWWRFVSAPDPISASAAQSPTPSPHASPPQPQEDEDALIVISGKDASMSGVVAILNRSNQYMRVTSNNGLAFNSSYRDDYALFAVRKLGGKVALINIKNGKHVNMYYIDDVMCQGPGGGLSLGVRHHSEGRVNLTISGYQGQNNEIHYLSSDTGNEAYGGSLAVKKAADDSCLLSLENVIHSGVSGIIALRNYRGYYMKVTGDKGLTFDTVVYDDDARFIVQTRGRRIGLIGNNGLHLDLRSSGEVVYVRCEGGGEGKDFGVQMRSAEVCLNIPGQGRSGNETYYLSCRESDNGGYGSLEISSSADRDCWFRLENVSRR